jgi:hypothetical protein
VFKGKTDGFIKINRPFRAVLGVNIELNGKKEDKY